MNRNTLQWKPRDWLSLDFNKHVHHEPTNKNLLVELFTFLNQFIIWCTWWFIYTMSHLFQYADYRMLYHCVTSLEKKFISWILLVKVIKFLWRGFLFSDRLRTVRESAWQYFMQCVLLEPHKGYGKNRSVNCQVISNSVIQTHSFCLVRYYAGLALIVSVLMVGKAVDKTSFSKNNWFRFSSVQSHAF